MEKINVEKINTTACMACYLIGTAEEIANHKCKGVSGRLERLEINEPDSK